MIPVSVIVVTKNEAARIGRCLAALSPFDEVVVVDSNSSDETAALAEQAGAVVVPFEWNGQYPKKRQWCLDHLFSKHDWVFFVDADEVVTPALIAEIKALFKSGPQAAGYFIKGRYVFNGRSLRHGLQNNKLCLFDRRRLAFPVVDDLDLPGMGELEGHYQPVLTAPGKLERLNAPLLHFAYDERWDERHMRYAAWERGMNAKKAWPRDPARGREVLKRVFRALPGRGIIAFLHCYIVKRGFLEGRTGLWFAASRMRYYRMIGSVRP